jgi:hypothetical protein
VSEITAAEEKLIRRFLGIDMIGAIESTVGRIIPSPVYFQDAADYWATIESVSLTSQQVLEVTNIKFCSFYLKGFKDISGPADSPLVGLTYEIYVFSEYDLERTDENLTPDAFNRKMLKANDDFIAMVLGLKGIFQGLRKFAALDASKYSIQRTTSLVQNSFIENRGACRFVPFARGYQTSFDETVQLQFVAC